MWNRNIAVGAFVLTGLALFVSVLFTIGNEHRFFSRHINLYTEFANIGGLAKGSEVEVDGFDAGELTDIQVPNSTSGRFRLKLSIDERFRPLVKTDSVVTISTEGIVGDKLLDIQSGSLNALEASSSNTLPSKEPLSTANLLEKGSDLIETANATTKAVGNKLLGTLNAVTRTVNNTDDVITGLKQGNGPLGMFLRDETVAASLRQTVTNAQEATTLLKHASTQADALVTDLQSRDISDKVDKTISSVQSAARNFDATSQDVRQMVTQVAAPDDQGLSAGDNIRQALSNVTEATGNMVADTEALKHEFFFRGFFKHRGYYSLANLNPVDYRGNRVFQNPANPRIWLESAKLFEREQDGQEYLSPVGKAQIDAGVAELGEAAVRGPLVIEGYSSTRDSATQLIASHERALLVRNYIYSRYQIDLQNLGAVPLRDLPPRSAHKESWDGVCIVLLEPHRNDR